MLNNQQQTNLPLTEQPSCSCHESEVRLCPMGHSHTNTKWEKPNVPIFAYF